MFETKYAMTNKQCDRVARPTDPLYLCPGVDLCCRTGGWPVCMSAPVCTTQGLSSTLVHAGLHHCGW